MLDEAINDTDFVAEYKKTISLFLGYSTIYLVVGKWMYPTMSKLWKEWNSFCSSNNSNNNNAQAMTKTQLVVKSCEVILAIFSLSAYYCFTSRISNEKIFLLDEVVPDVAIKPAGLFFLELSQWVMVTTLPVFVEPIKRVLNKTWTKFTNFMCFTKNDNNIDPPLIPDCICQDKNKVVFEPASSPIAKIIATVNNNQIPTNNITSRYDVSMF